MGTPFRAAQLPFWSFSFFIGGMGSLSSCNEEPAERGGQACGWDQTPITFPWERGDRGSRVGGGSHRLREALWKALMPWLLSWGRRAGGHHPRGVSGWQAPGRPRPAVPGQGLTRGDLGLTSGDEPGSSCPSDPGGRAAGGTLAGKGLVTAGQSPPCTDTDMSQGHTQSWPSRQLPSKVGNYCKQ